MRRVWLAMVLWAVGAAAVPCPDNIKYIDGSYMKRGDRFYYKNQSPLINGDRVYYANGSTLKNGDNFYYPNGSNLKRNDSVYYPNGSPLKNGDRYYYANGTSLKNGSSFYYSNGATARRNGKLYRQDGTETPFPLSLTEPIGAYGWLRADVHPTTENIDLEFRDLFVKSEGVLLSAYWNKSTFTTLELDLNTGVPGEDVLVYLNAGQITCSLAAGGIPQKFTVVAPAGRAEITLSPGYDATAARIAVTEALQSLKPAK